MSDELERLRARIDELDRQVLGLYARRFELVREIAHAKERAGRAVEDPAREERMRAAYARAAAELGLEPTLCEGLLELILRESKGLQSAVQAEGPRPPGESGDGGSRGRRPDRR